MFDKKKIRDALGNFIPEFKTECGEPMSFAGIEEEDIPKTILESIIGEELSEEFGKPYYEDGAVLIQVPNNYTEGPYENEHACRLREPNKFQKDSFRRTSRKSGGKVYHVIMGKLKGESNMTEQAYRYPKKSWSSSQARSHCKKHCESTGTF